MRESGFWRKLKANLRLDMLSRIENKIDSGWPDVYAFHNNKSTWIELKCEKKFPSKIDFEPAQPNWLMEYSRIKGRCYVFLFVELENCLYVWLGSDARGLQKSTKGIVPLCKIFADDEGFEYLCMKLFI